MVNEIVVAFLGPLHLTRHPLSRPITPGGKNSPISIPVSRSPVVRVEHATGGYSPGTTDALFCANDTAGFLKAVHPSINPHSPALLRAERHVTAQLPAAAPVAQLIDAFDEGPDGWVALMLQYVEGHQPPLPWTNDAIAAVLDDLTAFSASVTPSPVTGLKGAGTELAHLVGVQPPRRRRPG